MTQPLPDPGHRAADDGAGLRADFFDGRVARAWPVRLTIEGDTLRIAHDAEAAASEAPPADRRVPLAEVQWPERTRHGARLAHLRDGASIQALDAAAWDAWARRSGRRESMVVRAQQSWRLVGVTVVLLLVVSAAGYVWGIPWMARGVLAALPVSADRAVGELVQESLDGSLLKPSRTPLARQQALRVAFAQAMQRAYPNDPCSGCNLLFRTSAPVGKADEGRTRIGPNAFALPGGTIVVTDEMLDLLKGRDDVLLGVLGHEYGHVTHRHGMRMLVQASLLGAAASVAWGDISSVLATAPVLLGQSAYSRDFEREADLQALGFLRANGISPLAMVELFDRLADFRRRQEDSDADDSKAKDAAHKNGAPDSGEKKDSASPPGADAIGIAFASHPADEERVRFFREAGR